MLNHELVLSRYSYHFFKAIDSWVTELKLMAVALIPDTFKSKPFVFNAALFVPPYLNMAASLSFFNISKRTLERL